MKILMATIAALVIATTTRAVDVCETALNVDIPELGGSADRFHEFLMDSLFQPTFRARVRYPPMLHTERESAARIWKIWVMGGQLTLTVETNVAIQPARSVYVVSRIGGEVFADTCCHGGATNPVWGFYSENGHWVLEMVNQVVVDGVNLNDVRGYDEMFHYRMFGDEAVCLVRTGGRYRVWLGGELLPAAYDFVPHHYCCEPSLLNPGDLVNGFYFLARRNGVPILVEVTREPQDSTSAN